MWQILEYSLADSLDTASSVNAVQESTCQTEQIAGC